MDALKIKGIEVICILGDRPEERVKPQRIQVDVALEIDLEAAAMSDSLDDTVDYAVLTMDIRDSLEKAKCHLLERAADVVADVCLADPRVTRASVVVRKFGGIPGIESAEVKISRTA